MGKRKRSWLHIALAIFGAIEAALGFAILYCGVLQIAKFYSRHSKIGHDIWGGLFALILGCASFVAGIQQKRKPLVQILVILGIIVGVMLLPVVTMFQFRERQFDAVMNWNSDISECYYGCDTTKARKKRELLDTFDNWLTADEDHSRVKRATTDNATALCVDVSWPPAENCNVNNPAVRTEWVLVGVSIVTSLVTINIVMAAFHLWFCRPKRKRVEDTAEDVRDGGAAAGTAPLVDNEEDTQSRAGTPDPDNPSRPATSKSGKRPPSSRPASSQRPRSAAAEPAGKKERPKGKYKFLDFIYNMLYVRTD